MQCASRLLMVRPVRFGYNAETAVNNIYQQPTGDVQQQALAEFDAFVALLRRHDIDVTVWEDTADPLTPDSIFPNNWLSTHAGGQVFLYPMFAASRRGERSPVLLDRLCGLFAVEHITDLSYFETQELFLEGTGSMVLDREIKSSMPACQHVHIPYPCRSFAGSPVTLPFYLPQPTMAYRFTILMS